MPKALELTGDTFEALPAVPRAAQVPLPRAVIAKAIEGSKKKTSVKAALPEKQVPLQVRWPRSEVKAAKLAAMQNDFSTVSEFMLACFHAYMQLTSKKS